MSHFDLPFEQNPTSGVEGGFSGAVIVDGITVGGSFGGEVGTKGIAGTAEGGSKSHDHCPALSHGANGVLRLFLVFSRTYRHWKRRSVPQRSRRVRNTLQALQVDSQSLKPFSFFIQLACRWHYSVHSRRRGKLGCRWRVWRLVPDRNRRDRRVPSGDSFRVAARSRRKCHSHSNPGPFRYRQRVCRTQRRLDCQGHPNCQDGQGEEDGLTNP